MTHFNCTLQQCFYIMSLTIELNLLTLATSLIKKPNTVKIKEIRLILLQDVPMNVMYVLIERSPSVRDDKSPRTQSTTIYLISIDRNCHRWTINLVNQLAQITRYNMSSVADIMRQVILAKLSNVDIEHWVGGVV